MDNMDNMDNELLDNIIYLNDENGNEIPFEFLDLINYNNNEYVVLLPMDDEDEGEVLILKLEASDDPDMDNYVSVEDDNVLQAVFNIFKDKFKDEFHFVD